jgi:pyruvate carboxylase subunit B
VPIDAEVQKKALKGYDRGEEPITCRPAEVLEPELEKAKEEIGTGRGSDDDLVLYALYPVTGKKFLKWKYGKEEPPCGGQSHYHAGRSQTAERMRWSRKPRLVEKKRPKTFRPKAKTRARSTSLSMMNIFEVAVDEVGGSPVDQLTQPAAIAVPAVRARRQRPHPGGSVAAPAAPLNRQRPTNPIGARTAPAPAAAADGTPLKAPMPGMIVSYAEKGGRQVSEG